MADISIPKLTVQIREKWNQPWKTEGFLDVDSFNATLSPTIPHAVLRWNYGEIDDGGGSFSTYDPRLDGWHGWFVRICRREGWAGGARELVPVWHGIVCSDTDEMGQAPPGSAVPAGDQVPTARGLEMLLERSAIDGSIAEIGSAAVKIDNRLPFNFRRRRAVSATGNRSLAKYTNPDNGKESFVFSEDGEPWTAADIMEYALAWFAPPVMDWGLLGVVTNFTCWAPSLTCPGNVRALFNELVDRRRGHGWRVVVTAETPGQEDPGGQPAVMLYSVFDEAVATNGITLLGAQERLNLNGDAQAVEEVRPTRSSDHEADRIIVRGGPIIVCGTVSFAVGDVTLVKGWSDELETAYDAADETERMSERYSSVYRAYTLAGTDRLNGPSCKANGDLDWETTAPQLWGYKTLLRHIPFALDEDGDGLVDFRPPLVMCEIVIGEDTVISPVDRLAETAKAYGATSPSFSVRMLDGEAGFVVTAQPNYLLALNQYSGKTTDTHAPMIDYTKVSATVAWAGDEYLQVVEELPSSDAPECVKSILIEVPTAVAWVSLANTITDIEGEEIQISVDPVVLRNDVEVLRAVAAMARSWYQRRRTAVTVRWATLDFQFAPGAMLETILGSNGPMEAYSTVTEVTWDARLGRTELMTDFLELDFRPPGGWKASAAGLETPSLGDPGFADRHLNLPVRQAASGSGGGPAGSFGVRVWQDGGTTDGDRTDPCDRTYTVRTIEATAVDAGGQLLGEGMTPEIPRPERGMLQTAPAGGGGLIGSGYYDSAGVFHLWHAGECPHPED